ncbi:MAG: hypothetical protein WBS19_11025 [Candidatus Korobacteraceae bacterium]
MPGVSSVATLLTNTDALIEAEFTVPQDYALQQVLLAYKAQSVSFAVVGLTCRAEDVISKFSFITKLNSLQTFGGGVARYFHVVKVSIVNKCDQGIVVPLAGMIIFPRPDAGPASGPITPYSLAEVTAVYNTDRKLNGNRAILFNILAAVATLGSAIEPFFGPGFTQAVAIWGGGFTTAAGTIFKDMSPEQLQNIASLSFGDSQQLGANGDSLTKYLFISRSTAKKKGQKKKEDQDPFGEDPDVDQPVNVQMTFSTVIASTKPAAPAPAPAPAPVAPAPVAPAPVVPAPVAPAPVAPAPVAPAPVAPAPVAPAPLHPPAPAPPN